MKMSFKLLPLIALMAASAHAADVLDQKSATVRLDVDRYAAISGLDDFVLRTSDISGAAGAVYTGSDEFFLESNSQVHVTVEGGDLSNGSNSIATRYDLDGAGMQFDTTADSVHAGAHKISASATLGAISAQKAGGYASVINVTVSAL